MLVLVLSLQAAVAPKTAFPAQSAKPPLRMSFGECRVGYCIGADTPDYRLTLERDVVIDPKNAALNRYGPACGITGMPVCPKKARRIFSTTID